MRAKRKSVSLVALAIALIVGFETFFVYDAGYDVFTNVLIILAALWAFVRALQTKALFGLLFLPVGIIWVFPLLGSDIFDQIGTAHFLAHSALSIIFAFAGFTFLSRQDER